LALPDRSDPLDFGFFLMPGLTGAIAPFKEHLSIIDYVCVSAQRARSAAAPEPK
jgi:hypothetical protein